MTESLPPFTPAVFAACKRAPLEGGMRRVISYGGGLDSWVMLLQAIERGERIDAVVFIDVGDGALDRDGEDPGEWSGTYRHLRDVVAPLCERNAIRFEWIDGARYPVRDARSLWAWLAARQQIPVGGPSRICTRIAKVERYESWLADAFPGEIVETWIGFEAGEESRADNDPNAGKPGAQRRNRFPLIEWGFCRCRCLEIARATGYPVPRKSACVFCPYGTRADWRALKREEPSTFDRVVKLEADKPMTKATDKKMSKKLSIKAFRTIRDKATNEEIGYQHTPLPMYVEQPDKKMPPVACKVCGASERATKATGCGYLEEGRAA